MIKCFGIRIKLHPLFTLLIISSALTGYFVEMVTLFTIVIIHEMGHVSAAKYFQWRVMEIRLLPFGGVAVVEESLNVPFGEDVIVAAAGPLQNAWMILVSLGFMHWDQQHAEWWAYFMHANLMIGCFNLLPILPLDGGRIMQVLLSGILPYYRSVVYGIFVSFIVCGGMISYSLFSGFRWNLLVIGVFIIVSNISFYRQLPYHFMRFLIQKNRGLSGLGEHAMAVRTIIAFPKQKMNDIFRQFMRQKYHFVFMVGAQGKLKKIIAEKQLLQSYFRKQ